MEHTKETKSKDQIQSEALYKLLQNNGGGIEVSMGVGKTKLGLMHMAELHFNTTKDHPHHQQDLFSSPGYQFLVVVPRLPIIDNWKAEAKEYGYEYLLPLIKFTTYRSLAKEKDYYVGIYLDECHSLKYSHATFLEQSQKAFVTIIGLTGTYPKYTKGEKGEMCNRFCPKIYEYKTDDAVEDKILNDYRIYIHMVDLSDVNDLEITMKGKTWKTSEKKNYEYWCNRIDSASTPKELQFLRVMRMKALMGYESKERKVLDLLSRRKTKTILFANTQAQADRLCKHSYHSSNKQSKENLEMFKSGEIEVLSAVEQLSEGVNIPNLKSGIIMHAYSNNRKASQKIGRLLRLNPNDTAGVHILCYRNTVDEDWVASAISHLNQEKVIWLS